ncbi:MAG: hypothetical protein RJB13_699, partial [Pseudomonadota bacterium]|jgi:1-acyl-sn-glycerol-3-phosphate acyltransferase
MSTHDIQQKTSSLTVNNKQNTGLPKVFMATYVWTVTPLLTIFFGSLTVLMAPFAMLVDKRRNLLHSIATLWAKSIVWANPWWTFIIKGSENLPPADLPVVYVANHQSQADILTVFLINRQFRWLAKAILFKIPFLGWAMSAAGYVAVKRGDRRSHVECFRQARQHLERGTSMLFFPEGTRSHDGRLLPFKSGAYKLAKECGVPILPITLEGASNLLPKGSFAPAVATVTITIHPMISSEGRSEIELSELSKSVIGSALRRS